MGTTFIAKDATQAYWAKQVLKHERMSATLSAKGPEFHNQAVANYKTAQKIRRSFDIWGAFTNVITN